MIVCVVLVLALPCVRLVAVWVSLSVHHLYAPIATITMTVVLVSVSLLMLIPYFAYVFDFLLPTRVVNRIQQTSANAKKTSDAGLYVVQDRCIRTLHSALLRG